MKLKILITVIASCVSQVTYPCMSSDILKVYPGKGATGVEEINLVLESADSGTKKTLKIFDDDGIANIFFLTSVTKSLRDDQIVSLEGPFVNSLKKAIDYEEKSIQRIEERLAGNSLDPSVRLKVESKIANSKESLERMSELAKAINQRGLSRVDFGTFMRSIFQPNEKTLGYEYSEFENGQFNKRPKIQTLLDILGEQTYNSISYVTPAGEYLTTRGGCGVRGQLGN